MGKLPYIHSYDIRAIFEEHFDTKTLITLTKAIVSEFEPKKIVIGYDMRVSSPQMFNIVSQTLQSCGIQVTSIGLASTPQLYFATCTKTSGIECDLGIIITASHNPKEYNGMKICHQNAIPISYDTGLQEVERRILQNDINTKQHISPSLALEIKEVSIQDQYHNYLLHYFANINDKPREKPLKIAIDYANAIGCHSNKPLLKQLEQDGFIKCVHIFDTLDGTFPNHEANPIIEENLTQLKKKVIEEECDFGISFDGDSDRIGCVDNLGDYIAPDILGCFLIEYFATFEEDFSSVCYDLRSTHEIISVCEKHNINCTKTRVGHSHIKSKMTKTNSQFAVELSGHFYFHQTDSIYDDALRALIEVILAFSYSKKTFSEEMQTYKTTLKSPEMNFRVENPDKLIEQSSKWFTQYTLINQYTLDGVSYEFEDFWVNIRKSNTEPLLRINVEVTTHNKTVYTSVLNQLQNQLN